MVACATTTDATTVGGDGPVGGGGPDAAARRSAIEGLLPLVRSLARGLLRRLPACVEGDDLVSAGTIGLMGAVDAYDPARGVALEAYALPRIRGAMLDELRAMDWVPRLVRRRAAEQADSRARVEARHGRAATDAEVADDLGLTAENYARHARDAAVVGVTSLCRQAEAAARDDDMAAALREQDLRRVAKRGLMPREKLLVRLYYVEGLTLAAIGRRLGLSEPRVCQMHADVLGRMRARLGHRRSEFCTN